ncbi:MAG TPA: UDP-N-acetylmuramate dehydrogenase, partial [Desulfatiglandales bacterium]|nr:UDP-N-acetylmuramate dehydrogenase [Desulfatiglandales bacterium]
PMGPYTTFRVGGKVEALCAVKDLVQLKELLSFAAKEHMPYLVVGKGSNILVKDKGLKGIALLLKGELEGVEEKEGAIHAGGGLGVSELVRFTHKQGLAGLEFLAGIPGTVGGAVAMNAGAWGKSTADVVEAVEIVKTDGAKVMLKRSELQFAYRKALLPVGSVVVKARFKGTKDRPEAVGERIRDYLERRKSSQPLEHPSAGSVFKNPPHDYAGRLIESAGLKGKRVGGAMISDKHANVIVNLGGASAEDILALMEKARQRVKEQTGIDLEPEIRVVGE